VERHFERLQEMLRVATARIPLDYFQLPVADADAVYRERVYCYELYHQLRCIWNDFPFSLGGEIDKTGHPHFQNGPYSRAKPDFLVHMAGSMDENLAAVEIKPANVKVDGIKEDLRKLTWFCQNARYFRGIFLLYGEAGEPNEVSQWVRHATDAGVELGRLACLYHRRAGDRAQNVPS
jgi:hypothetical protein